VCVEWLFSISIPVLNLVLNRDANRFKFDEARQKKKKKQKKKPKSKNIMNATKQ